MMHPISNAKISVLVSSQPAFAIGAALVLLTAIFVPRLVDLAGAQAIRSQEEIARTITIEKLSVQDGAVAGEVKNLSLYAVRDVQLFIRYTWLWDDERNPGKVDPGTSAYYMLPKEISPGGRLPFNFSPAPPLPKVTGGHFETSVSVAGFAEIIPQAK
jgi:hypothetical protein